MRKITSLLILLSLFVSLASCNKAPEDEISSSPSETEATSSVLEEPEEIIINPFTGEAGYNKDRVGTRPLAVTINNLQAAQSAQSGLDKADIVFETEVEGGITRLLAIYSDPSVITGKVGTLRSARVVFAEIAKGLNAYYIHHGYDPDYSLPTMNQISLERINIGSPYTFREQNGLAWEHTLYTTGVALTQLVHDKNWDTKTEIEPFANFADPNLYLPLSGGTAEFVSVPFSRYYVTDFIYDSETEKYARAKNKTPYLDLETGNKEEFKNIFVLKTTMSYYEGSYRRKIDLKSGSGYYISNGRYMQIKWSKKNSYSNFEFTDIYGAPLTVHAGNSYICIANTSVNVTIE